MPAKDEQQKVAIGAMLSGPGPAKYALPSLVGKGPQYTMRPTLQVPDKQASPGPKYAITQHLTVTGSKQDKSYTFGNRTKGFKDSKTPSSAEYNLTGMKPGRTAASYTMRPQFPQQKKFTTPGPSVYKLQSLTGTSFSDSRRKASSSWSMTGRSDIGSFTHDNRRTPGPKYAANLTTKHTQPSYSMGARNKDLTRAATPGPKYNIRSEGRQVRGGSFGVKHSQYAYVCPV